MEKYFIVTNILIGWTLICPSSVLTYGPLPHSNNNNNVGHAIAEVSTSTISPENNILSFVSYPSVGGSRPVVVHHIPLAEESKPEDYWWLKQDSPFSLDSNSANGIPPPSIQLTSAIPANYNYQQISSDKPKQNCVDYNCVPEFRICADDHACVPKIHCSNSVVFKTIVDALAASSPRNNKYCSVFSEACCKVITTETSFDGKIPPSVPSVDTSSSIATPVIIPDRSSYNVPVHSKHPFKPDTSSSSIATPVLIPTGTSYNVPAHSKDVVIPVKATINPEPSQVPYTGILNTTPYPGCAAALKCVPNHYCTVDGIMTATPVSLTKDLLERRVPLTECLDPTTGIIGKCCRDPDYKDSCPDHDHDYDHSDHHHSEDASEAEIIITESPIKKPIGGFTSKPSSFVYQHQFDSNVPSSAYDGTINAATNYVANVDEVKSQQIPQQQPIPQQPISRQPIPQQPIPQQPILQQPIPQQPIPQQPIGAVIVGGQVSESIPTPFFVSNNNNNNVDAENHIYNFDLVSSGVPEKINSPILVPVSPTIGIPSSSSPLPSYITSSTQQPSSILPSYVQYETSSEYAVRHHQQPSLIGSPPPDVQQSILPSLSVFVPPVHQPSTVIDSFSECGQYNIYENEGAVPWYATVISANNKTALCDAVIVSENAVLTSAHCLDYISSEDVEIKIGSRLSNSYVIKSAVISRHPQYDTRSYRKDVALVLLRQPIIFNQFIHKVCLPSYEQKAYSGECFVSTSANLNDASQNIKVQIFPYKDCENRLKNSYLGKYFVLGDGFTCVSALTDSGLCQSKIGSPIICNRGDNHYELYGTKSWDLGCQDYKKFSIFSNSDVGWIHSTVITPIDQLIIEEQSYLKKQFKGETLEEVAVEKKPGFALGYGK